MTAQEFQDIFGVITSKKFPNLKSWLSNQCRCDGAHEPMKIDNYQKNLAECPTNGIKWQWWKMLRDCDVDDVRIAVDECMRTREFRDTQYQFYAAEFRDLANSYDRGRRVAPDTDWTPLRDASQEERERARTLLYDSMRVLRATSILKANRLGFHRMPRPWQNRWRERFNNATSAVSTILEPAKYADQIIESNRLVHQSCMEELQSANAIHGSDGDEDHQTIAPVDGASDQSAGTDAAERSPLLAGTDQQRKGNAVPAMTPAESERLKSDVAALDDTDDVPF